MFNYETMYHDDDLDFTGSLKILEILENLACLLISETNTIFVKGVFVVDF